MEKVYKFLVINPGSTSTKIAFYENTKEIFSKSITHSNSELANFEKVADQFEFRKKLILDTLKNNDINKSCIDAVIGRGGNLKPCNGGTYKLNDAMIEDLREGVSGQHASNLGGMIAYSIANELGIEAYTVDPVIVDELDDFARISGIPEIQRKSKFHPLNQKSVARLAAKELGGSYPDFNFIIAHMGGGISVGVHKKGRIVDVNNALDGDGPFTPERSGGVPIGQLVEMCFSNKYTKAEIKKKITGGGGLTAYLGTNSGREIQKRIEDGDEYAKLIYETMAYQISKEIAAGAAVLKGKVDNVILTGGLAFDNMLVGWIKERVDFIAPVKVYPGEHEMIALVQGVLRVLNGEESLQEYN